MRTTLVLLLLTLAGCTGNLRSAPGEQRDAIVATALAQVGKPYRYAGADPDTGFDCSGLVHYSYAQSGVSVPRSSQELLRSGEMVSYEDAQPGDLLFYQFDDKKKLSSLHVILFTGDGEGVHAPVTGKQVSTVRVNQPAWTSRHVGTVSLLGNAHAAMPPAQQVPAAAAPATADAITPPRAVEPAPALDQVRPGLLETEAP